jgi:hypothetical protein
MFRSSYYSSISFTQWLSHLPPELVKAHFQFFRRHAQGVSEGRHDRDRRLMPRSHPRAFCTNKVNTERINSEQKETKTLPHRFCP